MGSVREPSEVSMVACSKNQGTRLNAVWPSSLKSIRGGAEEAIHCILQRPELPLSAITIIYKLHELHFSPFRNTKSHEKAVAQGALIEKIHLIRLDAWNNCHLIKMGGG